MNDVEILFYMILAWLIGAAVLLIGAYRDHQRIREERAKMTELMRGEDCEDKN